MESENLQSDKRLRFVHLKLVSVYLFYFKRSLVKFEKAKSLFRMFLEATITNLDKLDFLLKHLKNSINGTKYKHLNITSHLKNI